MGEKVWNVAIVGAGWVAGAYLEVFRKRDDIRVTHVVASTLAKACAETHNLDAATHDNIDAALKDPSLDIVGVFTPHDLHACQAIAAAQAGKHLIVEKPLCISLEELRAIRAAAKATGVVLPTSPWVKLEAKGLIDRWIDLSIERSKLTMQVAESQATR